MKKWISLLIFIFIMCVPAVVYAGNQYSDTVNAVFDRLEGRIWEESEAVKDDQEELRDEEDKEQPTAPVDEKTPTEQQRQEKESAVPPDHGDEFIIGPIPDFAEGTILERLYREDIVSTGGVSERVDRLGTAVYRSISQGLIGIAPVILIIGALFLLFSRGRAVGFLFLFGMLMFVVLFAPEIIKIFIGIISGIFQ